MSELEAGPDPMPGGRCVHRAEPAHGPKIPIQPCSRRCCDWRSQTRGVIAQSPLRWTTRSLRYLAEDLSGRGTRCPRRRWVGCRDRRTSGAFSPQANVKTLEGAQHPDRDAQLRYINEQVKQHQADGEPVISVDTKKREAVQVTDNLTTSFLPRHRRDQSTLCRWENAGPARWSEVAFHAMRYGLEFWLFCAPILLITADRDSSPQPMQGK
ncbi:ISAzo13-like element transposase-related protein [Streptomyces agglomeratus]|uniref:ISAzo13-like element transposase-related protein n=1 Tax=Streptomyces agglomeratus TaxID=285458 RepID=UPI00159EF809|nr:hypothetical protein [Streptomyces agglomeratus]